MVLSLDINMSPVSVIDQQMGLLSWKRKSDRKIEVGRLWYVYQFTILTLEWIWQKTTERNMQYDFSSVFFPRAKHSS